MAEGPGKLKEKVVAILEQHMDQTARVRCDVHLPVLSDPDLDPRQVDVLIETGSENRPTLTIVEVQDRASKPSRTDFDGWLVKMREVGAQHLMCVNRAGYTRTQLRKAERLGPTVRLFTLDQLKTGRRDVLPPTFMSNTFGVVTYGRLLGIEFDPIVPFRMHPDIDPQRSPDPHYKLFKPAGREQPVSPTEVTDWHLFAHPKNIAELPHTGEMFRLTFGYRCSSERPWYIKTADRWTQLRSFRILIELKIEECPIVWRHELYEQIGRGEVGWIVRGTASHGGHETSVFLPLRKEEEGLYSAGRATAMASEDVDTFIGYGDVGHPARRWEELMEENEE